MRGIDDLMTKAKLILRKYKSEAAEAVQLTDPFELSLMRLILSFHPSKHLDDTLNIFIASFERQPTFFLMQEARKPEAEDAISVKKCLKEMAVAVNIKQRETSETRYHSSSLKRIGLLLAKLIELYPACASSLILH
jgi:hypothetical protein